MADEITSPIDWLQASEEQRKKLYPVAKAIKDVRRIDDWNAFMALFMTVPIKYSSDYKGSIRSGRLKRENALDLWNWIAAHHLDIGQKLASDIFPKSMSTPWESFINVHGVYGHLGTTNPLSFGLTRRDGDLPIAEEPIKLGEPYCFQFESQMAGHAIMLESHEGGDWQAIPIGSTEHDLAATIEIKSNIVPWDNATNKAEILREHKDNGLRQFVLLIGSDEAIKTIASKIATGLPISPTTFNEVAEVFTSSTGTWELHRLNVVFVR